MQKIGVALLLSALALSVGLSDAEHADKPSIVPTCSLTGEALSQADADLCLMQWLVDKDEDTLKAAEHARFLIYRTRLKSFVNEVVETHQKEIRQLTALQKQWYPSIALNPQSGLDIHHELHALANQDADYDATFIHFMLARHQEVIDALENASRQVQHPELKAFIKKAIRMREKHDALLNYALYNPGRY